MAYTVKNVTGVPVRIGTKTITVKGKQKIVDDVIEPHSEKVFAKKADLKEADKMPNLLIDGEKKVNVQTARVTIARVTASESVK